MGVLFNINYGNKYDLITNEVPIFYSKWKIVYSAMNHPN
jgi:hypothetical protein